MWNVCLIVLCILALCVSAYLCCRPYEKKIIAEEKVPVEEKVEETKENGYIGIFGRLNIQPGETIYNADGTVKGIVEFVSTDGTQMTLEKDKPMDVTESAKRIAEALGKIATK